MKFKHKSAATRDLPAAYELRRMGHQTHLLIVRSVL